MKKLKIWYWRNRGRRARNNVFRLYEDYDCGALLIDELTGGALTKYTEEMQYCVDKLRELDGARRRHTDR